MLYSPDWNVLGHIIICMLTWNKRKSFNIKITVVKTDFIVRGVCTNAMSYNCAFVTCFLYLRKNYLLNVLLFITSTSHLRLYI